MSDICTLVPMLTLNAVMCASKPICSPSQDGTKQLCMSISMSCPLPPPTYDCIGPDGKHYQWQEPTTGGTIK